MASTTASASSSDGGRDDKIIHLLSNTFQKLDDFKEKTDEATLYAAAVVAAARANNNDDEEFRDQIMCIVANVRNLNGQIQGRAGTGLIAPADLAVMNADAMRTHQQKQRMAAIHRKRAREQTNIDKTSLHCTKCGLVRRDRLNINELALDSEENGSHFDYNFDNVCTCSHSSEEESDDSDEEKEEANRKKWKSSQRSSSRSSTESS